MDRSRSPRSRGFGHHDDFPLVEFLVSRHILDDRSADLLRKAPRDFAIEVLVSLGPDVRNPSAFITRKLAPTMGQHDHMGTPAIPDGGWQPSGEMNRSENPGVINVWANGHQQELFWSSQEQAVADLKSWGVLDDASGDFLLKAQEHDAREVIAAIGPAVKNPSAFVTRKLKEIKNNAAAHNSASATPGVEGGPVQVFFNGTYHTLQWNSREEALAQLVSMGVLDDGSADFLMKAPEAHAKAVVASIGPDVRNPSALVTRKLRELRAQEARQGGGSSYDGGDGWRKEDVIMVHCGGSAKPLHWQSKELAMEQLKAWGVLDDVSADFLSKAPEHCAKEIIGSLGPEVRNPSALVTRKVKELLQGGFADGGGGGGGGDRGRGGGGMLGPGMGGCGMGMGGCGMGGCGMGGCSMGGCGMGGCGMGGGLGGGSTQEMVRSLMQQGVLDQSSVDLLTQLPEQRAREILSGLSPDVKNPSAWVTRQVSQAMNNSAQFGGGGGGMMGNSMMPGGGMMQMNPMGGGGGGMMGNSMGSMSQGGGGMMGNSMMQGGGGKGFMSQGGAQGELKVHFNGEDIRIPWTSKSEVLQFLSSRGVLDEKSCDFLTKMPDAAAREILSSLRPEVRNPSALVTQKAKKFLDLQGAGW